MIDMEHDPRGTENLTLVRFAQYITGLTPRQNVWSEIGTALVRFFKVDVAAFGRMDDADMVVHGWSFAGSDAGREWSRHFGPDREEGESQHDSLAALNEAFLETLECGFLSTRQLSEPGMLSLAFLPINMENRTSQVMMVGVGGNAPFSRDMLNVYLAVAGLIGTSAERLAADEALREYRLGLEQLVRERTEVLTERMKELDCLYHMSNLTEQAGISEGELLQAAVKLIPTAFRHTDSTCACITAGKKTFATPIFQKTPWTFGADIFVNNSCHGRIDVYSLRAPSAPGEPFSREEQNLIQAMAQNLGRHLDRVRAEQAVRDSERKLSTLFDSMSEAVLLYELITDDQGRPVNYLVTDCNAAFTKITGIARKDVVGRLGTDLHQIDKAPYLPEFSHVAQTGEPKQLETCFAPMAKHFFTSVVSMGGNRFATVATDITQRKQAEEKIKSINQQLHKSNAEKDMLFTIIAHDLKSPMCGLVASTEMLANEPELLSDKAIRTLRKELHKNAKNTFALLEDLLQWARMSQGGIDFALEACGLDELVDIVLSTAQDMAKAKEIPIRLDLPQSLTVLVDQPMLKTVLRNILFNAIKFTHRGGEIVITARQEGQTVTVAIQDNGIGMNEQIVSSAFFLEKEKRQMGTEGEKGTGLGLVLCKQFIEQHGGHIWVESEPGKGTTVFFTLPTQETRTPQTAEPLNR